MPSTDRSPLPGGWRRHAEVKGRRVEPSSRRVPLEPHALTHHPSFRLNQAFASANRREGHACDCNPPGSGSHCAGHGGLAFAGFRRGLRRLRQGLQLRPSLSTEFPLRAQIRRRMWKCASWPIGGHAVNAEVEPRLRPSSDCGRICRLGISASRKWPKKTSTSSPLQSALSRSRVGTRHPRDVTLDFESRTLRDRGVPERGIP